MAIIEQAADIGFAVRRNGVIILRTASDTDWQAMLNGLVLCFGHDLNIGSFPPSDIREGWSICTSHSDERFEIIRVRAIEAET